MLRVKYLYNFSFNDILTQSISALVWSGFLYTYILMNKPSRSLRNLVFTNYLPFSVLISRRFLLLPANMDRKAEANARQSWIGPVLSKFTWRGHRSPCTHHRTMTESSCPPDPSPTDRTSYLQCMDVLKISFLMACAECTYPAVVVSLCSPQRRGISRFAACDSRFRNNVNKE
jgi:hypothetical protein